MERMAGSHAASRRSAGAVVSSAAAARPCAGVLPWLLARDALPTNLPQYMLAMGLVAVALLVLVAIVAVVRQKLLRRNQRFDLDSGFSLVDLRQMLRDGQITEAEYERARASVAAHGLKAAGADAPRPGNRSLPPAQPEPEVEGGSPDKPSTDSDNDGEPAPPG